MDHETTTQDHDHQPTTRSSGRRKAKGGGGGGNAKKHKQPRRGMGVAKLERLREQGEITETDRAGFPLPFPEMNNQYHQLHSYGPTWNPVGFPGFYGLVGSDRRLLQSHNQFGNDRSDFVVKSSSDDKCYSLQCNACHKKKKINGAGMYKCGDRRFLGLDFGDNQNVLNQDSPNNIGGAKPPQKVEVVAVLNKGSSSSSWDGGNHHDRVVMEYDFFPPAAKSGRRNEEGGELGNSSMGRFDASNCVDLSLKLSY